MSSSVSCFKLQSWHQMKRNYKIIHFHIIWYEVTYVSFSLHIHYTCTLPYNCFTVNLYQVLPVLPFKCAMKYVRSLQNVSRMCMGNTNSLYTLDPTVRNFWYSAEWGLGSEWASLCGGMKILWWDDDISYNLDVMSWDESAWSNE